VNLDITSLSIVGPALVAGALVLATHVPLGQEVLRRGIIFIDLAVAQIAGLGVISAGGFGLEAHGIASQVAAFASALIGAALLIVDRQALRQDPGGDHRRVVRAGRHRWHLAARQ
jgi:zinc/manganese transport system permease protein